MMTSSGVKNTMFLMLIFLDFDNQYQINNTDKRPWLAFCGIMLQQ